MAQSITKHRKPFTNGELIKDRMITAAEEMWLEKANLFKNISLSSNTAVRRLVDIAENILTQGSD